MAPSNCLHWIITYLHSSTDDNKIRVDCDNKRRIPYTLFRKNYEERAFSFNISLALFEVCEKNQQCSNRRYLIKNFMKHFSLLRVKIFFWFKLFENFVAGGPWDHLESLWLLQIQRLVIWLARGMGTFVPYNPWMLTSYIRLNGIQKHLSNIY